MKWWLWCILNINLWQKQKYMGKNIMNIHVIQEQPTDHHQEDYCQAKWINHWNPSLMPLFTMLSSISHLCTLKLALIRKNQGYKELKMASNATSLKEQETRERNTCWVRHFIYIIPFHPHKSHVIQKILCPFHKGENWGPRTWNPKLIRFQSPHSFCHNTLPLSKEKTVLQ